MGTLLQVCLFNTEPESSDMLRKKICELNFLRLVGEVSTAEGLAEAIQDGDANIVFFHLDPDAAEVLEVIDQVSTRFPELAMIAISDDRRPDAILAPIRAGCDQFICEPIDHTELAAAVGRVASRRFLTQNSSQTVCVTGVSGGAGATSIACNLAMEIGHITEKTCGLFDMNFQFGDVATYFDCEPKFTMQDLISSGTDLDRSLLAGTMVNLPCNVALLARPDSIEQSSAITPELVHRVLDVAKNIFETVVVDVPRQFDPCTATILGEADLILMVSQLTVPSVRNAQRYRDALQRLGVPTDRIELIVNRSDGRGERITVKDLEHTFNKPVYATIPNDYQFVARSIDFGKPIASLDRNNPVLAAIGAIAEKIASGTHGTVKKTEERKGFFRKLLAK